MTVYTITRPVARKAHTCEMCRRRIDPGERYLRGKSIGDPENDGRPTGWVECAHCHAFRCITKLDQWADDGYTVEDYAEFEPGTEVERAWHAQWKAAWRDPGGGLVPIPSRQGSDPT